MTIFQEDVVTTVPRLRAFARSLTNGDRQLADDLVQDTVVNALRAQRQFTAGTNLEAWLFAILRNTCSTWRSRRRQAGATESFDERTHSPHTVKRDQEQQMIDARRVATLRHYIEMLPLEFREVLIMRELEEMSYRQISESIAVPVGTVMSRLSRARRRLAEYAAAASIRKNK